MEDISEKSRKQDAGYLLKSLKNETKQIHEDIEGKNLARFIIDHTITIAQYKDLILHNFKSYQKLECFIWDHKDFLTPALQQFCTTEKSDTLLKDIKELNLKVPEISRTVPITPDTMSLVGILYVMEGSMLGSLMIANHIDKCPNLDAITTFHFFSNNAIPSISRWKNFKEVLDTGYFTETDIKNAVEAAKVTFRLFTMD